MRWESYLPWEAVDVEHGVVLRRCPIEFHSGSPSPWERFDFAAFAAGTPLFEPAQRTSSGGSGGKFDPSRGGQTWIRRSMLIDAFLGQTP